LRKYLRDYLPLIAISGSIIILDQITKNLVRNLLEFTESWSPWEWLEPFARIVHWNNTGSAFGFFQGMGTVFMILAIVVSIIIIIYYPRVPREDWLMRLALSMQLAGAVGNLIDRLLYGTVTDFISVGTFAVFNVADASISVGTALLILDLFIKERKERKQVELQGQNPGNEASKPEIPQTEVQEGDASKE